MLKKLDRITQKRIYENPYWEYIYDTYRLPDNSIGEYYYVNSRGSVMIIPELEDGRLVMTKQFRYLNQRESLEFPGGGLKIGMSLIDNAEAELEEETGFRAQNIDLIGQFNPMNGVSNEICSVFKASNLTLYKANPEVTEEFEILFCDKEEIFQAISTNDIWDGMTLASWMFYLNVCKK